MTTTARRIVTGALLAIALTTLAGCSTDQAARGHGPASMMVPPSKPKPVLVADLAAQLGCTASLKPAAADGGAPWFGSREDATCQLNRTPVSLVTFPPGTDVADWVSDIEAMGGVWLVGKGWAAQASTQGVAEQVQAKLGGHIR